MGTLVDDFGTGKHQLALPAVVEQIQLSKERILVNPLGLPDWQPALAANEVIPICVHVPSG